MAGNAWEWTGNWYDDNQDSIAVRGGSWDYYPQNLLCAARCLRIPQYSWNDHGFRVVCFRPQL
ncbi:MAG: SUMF1/EgtB/PvdO family nonheme iron enzyme, partial [Candidatus Aminicenantes bacterium]|nr:SUMF1/EgtB/PvdO family nonheme iron enzyme [Candidatus Aminicenantes bacterium]